MTLTVKYSRLASKDFAGSQGKVTEEDDGDFELSSSVITSNEKLLQTDDVVEFKGDSLDDTDVDAKRLLQLWRLENLAVPLCYFMVGLVQGITYPLINVYPLDLGATEAQQATIWFLKGLPSCLKILFGFLSDNVPIAGYRRKPYMFIGFMISVASMLVLLMFSDLSLERVANTGTNADTDGDGRDFVVVPPSNAPSILLLSGIFFVWAMGIWWSDVMGDSLVAEKAKYETNADRGNLQACCYLLRGFGVALMAPISSLTYNTRNGPWFIIAASAIFPIFLLPFIYQLEEKRMVAPEQTTREQIHALWKTACSKAVWQPMGFIYIYIALFVSNAAWREFLKSVLGFTANQLNALLFVAGALAFMGVVIYKFVLIRWSWRHVFMIGIMLNGVFSLMQVLLIRGQTFGLDPFWFSLGDDGVRDFLMGTQYLPMCVMMVNLVPSGIEGASYALFTTTWNAAGALSDALSTVLLSIWDVRKETMIAGDLSGLIKLTVLTTILQVIPLLFVGFLPHSVDDLSQLKMGGASSSSILGGSLYLMLVFLSVLFAVFIGIMNMIHPGWMGES